MKGKNMVSVGRVGVRLGGLGLEPAAVACEALEEIEDLGCYSALWVGEVLGAKEVLSHAGLLLAGSRRLVIATGIANIWARDPMAMVAGANTLAEAYPGRFALGLGVSHGSLVQLRGHAYQRPVAAMRSYLDAMDAVEYKGPEPPAAVPRVLAALRPKMLELAAERTDGAHPYLVPVEHTSRARELMGDGPLLAPNQTVLLLTNPATARRTAREYMRLYLTLENYRQALLSLGFEERDLREGGSDDLVDALVAWGDVDTIQARVRAHFDAGADHVCVQPLGMRPGDLALDQLRELAPALSAFL